MILLYLGRASEINNACSRVILIHTHVAHPLWKRNPILAGLWEKRFQFELMMILPLIGKTMCTGITNWLFKYTHCNFYPLILLHCPSFSKNRQFLAVTTRVAENVQDSNGFIKPSKKFVRADIAIVTCSSFVTLLQN